MKYCLSLLLLLFATSAHAELHKWVDANGNVHYSDVAPPSTAQEQRLNLPKAPPAGESGNDIFKREAELNKRLKEKAKTEQQAEQKRQQAAVRKQNCSDSRDMLQTLLNSPRVSTYDASGNRTLMDDATRQQKIEQARTAIKENCD